MPGHGGGRGEPWPPSSGCAAAAAERDAPCGAPRSERGCVLRSPRPPPRTGAALGRGWREPPPAAAVLTLQRSAEPRGRPGVWEQRSPASDLLESVSGACVWSLSDPLLLGYESRSLQVAAVLEDASLPCVVCGEFSKMERIFKSPSLFLWWKTFSLPLPVLCAHVCFGYPNSKWEK